MRTKLLLVLATALLLSMFSCKSTDTTEPIVEDDQIITLIDPEACNNWLEFFPVEEVRGQYWVQWDNEIGQNPVVSVTFNGSEVELTSGNSEYYGTVSASPGQTYSGVFTADGVDYPYTIKMAYNLTNVTCDNNTTTPHLSWQLPASNMHLFMEGWWDTEDGDEDYIDTFLPANKRDYVFPSHPYKDVTVATLNSFNSHNNQFGVYSWSYKKFTFE